MWPLERQPALCRDFCVPASSGQRFCPAAPFSRCSVLPWLLPSYVKDEEHLKWLPTTVGCHAGTTRLPVTFLVLRSREGRARWWPHCPGLQWMCRQTWAKLRSGQTRSEILTWELCQVFTKTLLHAGGRREAEGKLVSKFFGSTLHTRFSRCISQSLFLPFYWFLQKRKKGTNEQYYEAMSLVSSC